MDVTASRVVARVRTCPTALRSHHLARNSGMVMAGTAVSGLLGFVYWGVAARGYSSETVGVATALLSAMTLASLSATLGLGQTIIQRLPRADDVTWSKAVNTLVFGGAASGAIVGLVSVALLPLLSHRFAVVHHPAFAPLIVLGTSALTVANLLDYVFIAQRAAHHVLLRSALFGVSKLLLLLAPLAFAQLGLAAVVTAWVAAALLTSAFTLRALLPRLGRPHRWSTVGVATELRVLAPLLVRNHSASLSAALIPTLMPVLVVSRVSATANAYFYMAWLVASILLTVSPAVAGAMLAEGSYEPERLGSQVRTGGLIIGGLLIGPVVVLCLLGPWLLAAFGSSYASNSYELLLLFMIVVIPDAVTNVYVTVLRVRSRVGVAAAMNFTMSATALSLAWVLLPRFGVTAAGWSWVAGQSVGCAIVAGHLRWGRRPHPQACSPVACVSQLEGARA